MICSGERMTAPTPSPCGLQRAPRPPRPRPAAMTSVVVAEDVVDVEALGREQLATSARLRAPTSTRFSLALRVDDERLASAPSALRMPATRLGLEPSNAKLVDDDELLLLGAQRERRARARRCFTFLRHRVLVVARLRARRPCRRRRSAARGVEPWRAWPVPFCLYELLAAAADLADASWSCACRRGACARCAFTTSQRRCSLTSAPKTASARSTRPTFLPSMLYDVDLAWLMPRSLRS